jgi:hypothetical protein
MIYENENEIWFMKFMVSEGFHEMSVVEVASIV